MTNKEIVELTGYEIHRCESDWGGTWGYSKKGENWNCNGFKSEKALVDYIVKERFGNDDLGKLCLDLLRKHENENTGNKYKWTIRICDGDGFFEYIIPDGRGDISISEVAKNVYILLGSKIPCGVGKFVGINDSQ